MDLGPQVELQVRKKLPELSYILGNCSLGLSENCVSQFQWNKTFIFPMKIVISGYPLLTPIVREASRGTPRNSSGRIVVCSSSSEEVMRTTEGSITALALYTRICPCHAYIYIYIHTFTIYIYIHCVSEHIRPVLYKSTCITIILYIYYIYYIYIYTSYRSIITKPPKPTSSLEYYTT